MISLHQKVFCAFSKKLHPVKVRTPFQLCNSHVNVPGLNVLTFCVCGQNPDLWGPCKWNILSITFLWWYLLRCSETVMLYFEYLYIAIQSCQINYKVTEKLIHVAKFVMLYKVIQCCVIKNETFKRQLLNSDPFLSFSNFLFFWFSCGWLVFMFFETGRLNRL